MAWFIVAIILAIVAALAILATRASNETDVRKSGLVVGIVVAVLAGGIVFFDSYVIIPTRTVGVVTSFGQIRGALTSGFHFVAPWQSVENFDTTIKTLKLFNGKEQVAGDRDLPCATVRLANQTTACVDATVQWNIDEKGDVVDLYRRFRTFDNIEINLVERQLQRALNVVFEDYNPLASINGATGPGETLDDLAKKATNELKSAVGAGITIDTITIPLVHYDAVTQSKLDAYAQALADTRIAEQRKQTAQKTAEANALLDSSSSTKDPGVQYQNCLNLIADLAAKNQLQNLPPTFTCGNGSQTPVIVGK